MDKILEFVKVFASVLTAMGANIVLGAELARMKNEFAKEKLYAGMFKAGTVLVGITLLYGSALLNDVPVTEVAGIQVNFIGAMQFIFNAGVLVYGALALDKLRKLFGVKVADTTVKEPQYGVPTGTDQEA